MKIYTKKGDDGTTGLYNGGRIAKNALCIQLMGEVDELNSFVGLLNAKIKHDESKLVLNKIQHYLFEIGAQIAQGKEDVQSLYQKQNWISLLENEIDNMESELTPLRNFILPGGSETIANAHICRTICRRVERSLVTFNEGKEYSETLKFINRLSDYFFVLARFIAKKEQVEEVLWIQEKLIE